jgi:hypothetical protein
MWEPVGEKMDAGSLGDLYPEEVLFAFEEPLTFTCRDRHGRLLIGHSLCSQGTVSRYLLASAEPDIVDGLKDGRLDVLTALRQPRCWIVDFGPGWETKGLWLITFDKIPKDHLPKAGAMINPCFDLAPKLRGPNL